MAGVKPVASEARVTRCPPGTRLLRAGLIAFTAVIVSWLVVEAVNGALSLVDLTVYRDGGLIVRHVRPYYVPGSYAPLYDWGGFSALALSSPTRRSPRSPSPWCRCCRGGRWWPPRSS